jgi:hypothetical protein
MVDEVHSLPKHDTVAVTDFYEESLSVPLLLQINYMKTAYVPRTQLITSEPYDSYLLQQYPEPSSL